MDITKLNAYRDIYAELYFAEKAIDDIKGTIRFFAENPKEAKDYSVVTKQLKNAQASAGFLMRRARDCSHYLDAFLKELTYGPVPEERQERHVQA